MPTTSSASDALDRPAQLLHLARAIAARDPRFHEVRGPGPGDHSTNAFMKELRAQALAAFGTDFSEKKICGETSLATDFYFPDERTIVEVALGLPNPNCEFEKDVLKAIMAAELGAPVSRLYFITRPGGIKKCDQPGRAAVRAWALSRHDLRIEVHELAGEPRKRRRRKTVQDARNLIER